MSSSAEALKDGAGSHIGRIGGLTLALGATVAIAGGVDGIAVVPQVIGMQPR